MKVVEIDRRIRAKSRTWPLRGSRSARSDRPWPRQSKRGDGKAARAQVAHGLEIFLDEFGAALEQADRALAAGRRRPARKAQRDAVGRLQRAGDHILGHRIGGDGNEGHDCGGRLRGRRRLIAGRTRAQSGGCKGADGYFPRDELMSDFFSALTPLRAIRAPHIELRRPIGAAQ